VFELIVPQSILEMQAVLTELVETFSFELPPAGMEYLRVNAGVMLPMIKDKMEEGVQMRLKISLVA
jgi:hypothetical protein